MRTVPQNVAQFTGSYLNRAWTRRFILGTLLQRYDPSKACADSDRTCGSHDGDGESRTSTSHTAALLQRQRWLSGAWGLPARPLDAVSEKRIFRLLARYTVGEGLLSDEALGELQLAFNAIPGAPLELEKPAEMLRLLHAVGYVQPGDNVHRVAYQGPLHYPPQAHALMEPFLSDALQRDGGDAFDAIRVHRPGPAYAIDSITTSEVDDAIGVEEDPETGEPIFTVYVSDATVYCAFDSPLEQVTARELTTTTYLPEGVFFMLPKPIVEAATLRDDRPCRTFNIRFKIDRHSGEVKAYAVEVGWLAQLRRITYDQTQALLVPRSDAEVLGKDGDVKRVSSSGQEKSDRHRGPGGDRSSRLAAHEQPPHWLTAEDTRKLHMIYEAARIRLAARQRRTEAAAAAEDAAAAGTTERAGSAESTNLPDPLVKVSGTTVLSVEDQIVCTQDARLAVAELMIAANEVCSRVAQANGLAIPYRGTRPRSSEHEIARYRAVAQGVRVMPSLDSRHTFIAEAIHATIQRLSSVTRAVYHHTPLFHAGLETSDYTHSTSPLRRYADMLVHHQLKVWLREQHGGLASASSQSRRASRGSSPGVVLSLDAHQLIPEFTMAALCAKISTQQEQASLLQDSSTRFWILRYVQDKQREASQTKKGSPLMLVALVGTTRDVYGSPEYARHLSDAEARTAALRRPVDAPSSPRMQAPPRPTPRYVSDIYIPSLQLAHTLVHNDARVLVGAVVTCRVLCVLPEQGVLELVVDRVEARQDERQLGRLWSGGVIASLDA